VREPPWRRSGLGNSPNQMMATRVADVKVLPDSDPIPLRRWNSNECQRSEDSPWPVPFFGAFFHADLTFTRKDLKS
jgi:hypothetical protein